MTKKKLVKSKKLVGMSVRSRKARKKYLEEHLDRSPQAQALDDNLEAPIAPTVKHWEQDPNRWDIPGVDARVDWRHMKEKERLRALEAGEIKPWTFEPKQKIEEEKLRLQWQKKHPFIAGTKLSTGGQTFDGIEQYLTAIREREKYGFRLDRPEADFLDTYNLKRFDIYGLKFMPLPEKAMSLRGAAGFYASQYSIMAMPPIDGWNQSTRERTIRHEIGHHIYDNSMLLRHRWNAGTYHKEFQVEMIPLKGGAGISMEVRGKPVMVDMSTAIRHQERYFRSRLPLRDIHRHWRDHYRRKGVRGHHMDIMLDNEAWAETFRTYRGGELKIAQKREQQRLMGDQQELARMERHYSAIKKIPKAKRIPAEQREFERRRAQISSYKKQIKGREALIKNYKTILAWMKAANKKGWYQGEKKGEIRFKTKHIKPMDLKEQDFFMYEADIEALELKKTRQHLFKKKKDRR